MHSFMTMTTTMTAASDVGGFDLMAESHVTALKI
jgi:hypothetical protein